MTDLFADTHTLSLILLLVLASGAVAAVLAWLHLRAAQGVMRRVMHRTSRKRAKHKPPVDWHGPWTR